MRDKLRALIDQLRLHGMAEVLDAELARAEREAIPAAELLVRLLGQEAAARRERSLAYRLAQARLPWRWSLDSFPFDRQPGVNKTQIQTLAGLDFLRRTDNVLLIGKPGTGKTGLALGCHWWLVHQCSGRDRRGLPEGRTGGQATSGTLEDLMTESTVLLQGLSTRPSAGRERLGACRGARG